MTSLAAQGTDINKPGGHSAAAAAGQGGSQRTAVYTYGRYQPPHIKHGEVIQHIAQDAMNQGGRAFLFPSQSYNNFDNSAQKTLSHPTKGKKSRKKQLQNPLHIRSPSHLLTRETL